LTLPAGSLKSILYSFKSNALTSPQGRTGQGELMSKKFLEHLKDIDLRSREERSKERIETYKEWYINLLNSPQTERISG